MFTLDGQEVLPFDYLDRLARNLIDKEQIMLEKALMAYQPKVTNLTHDPTLPIDVPKIVVKNVEPIKLGSKNLEKKVDKSSGTSDEEVSDESHKSVSSRSSKKSIGITLADSKKVQRSSHNLFIKQRLRSRSARREGSHNVALSRTSKFQEKKKAMDNNAKKINVAKVQNT